VNTVDPQLFRSRLSSYYAKYKQVYGSDIWDLLEGTVGKLG
jgi:hypothetical protein